ncbi:rRNA maturation RNase YbeY [Leptolyngbya sp. AN02str]|uniref:rRNA maturation RNase YbeY n=1 Tax=Leptolyngbya sp. AN02str TaxID=3423363 RepID=UPI003D311D53
MAVLIQVDVDVQTSEPLATPGEGSLAIAHWQNAVQAAPWETWFAEWLQALEPTLSPIGQYELSLQITTDAEIQALNAQYRAKDQPTDVLAFAALETNTPLPEEMLAEIPLYLGDIVISVETAERQAQERSHRLLEELAWLASHGLLHLLGWDHPDEPSLLSMLQQQSLLLQRVGLSIQYD